jgi:hypothetical protein
MLNTSANKAVYGGTSVALVYIVAKTLLWKWPQLSSLLTEEYLTMVQSAITGLVVWLVPNKETNNVV